MGQNSKPSEPKMFYISETCQIWFWYGKIKKKLILLYVGHNRQKHFVVPHEKDIKEINSHQWQKTVTNECSIFDCTGTWGGTGVIKFTRYPSLISQQLSLQQISNNFPHCAHWCTWNWFLRRIFCLRFGYTISCFNVLRSWLSDRKTVCDT